MKLPNDSQRLSIYGMTGSGKTVAALWHLSHRSYTSRPWVIFDFKGDAHIATIPHTQELAVGDVPKKPGIYITRPVPEVDDSKVEKAMWGIWQQEKTGVLIDEGFMVHRSNSGFKALLTQGRSKSIPMINLSQRPVWISKFMVSEADFHQVYFLADESDRDTIQRFIPYDVTENRLPRFHSYYYDIGSDDFTGLKPVPHPQTILETFDKRLRKTTRFL